MKFAYADPPYYGHSAEFYSKLHENASEYDTLEAHAALINRMCEEFDGWALSLSSTNLKDILPLCPTECRVMAWVKPFASFKPSVRLAYAREPVIVWRGRKRRKEQRTVRDWCAENIALKKGLVGAKPEGLIFWILEALNAEKEDEIVDIFHGSGSVKAAIEKWRSSPELPLMDVYEEIPEFESLK